MKDSDKNIFIIRLLGILIISVFVVIIAWKTIEPNTWLMGWDSVMSEFDLGLAWRRAIAGVWQEHQGLGLVGGHGYVSDLVRLPLLWFLSILFPDNLIRYIYTFLTWYVGGLGVYFLSYRLISKKNISKFTTLFISLSVVSVYLLHPFTIQNYFVIHDAFAWFFGTLPWLILSLINVIEKPNRGNYLWWLLVSFIFSFSGFIPPVFVGVSLFIAILLLVWWFSNKKKNLKQIILVLLVFLVANAYWLLPFGYFTLIQRDVYLEAKLNRETTPENILKSEYYGTWDKFITGQGFYYDSLDVGRDRKETVRILENWIEWLEQGEVKFIMIIIFAFGIVGWIIAWKNPLAKSMKGFSLASLVVVGLLVIGSPPFNWLSWFWYKIPVLGQAFRIPFTKLSILYVFCLSLLMINFVMRIIDFLNKRKNKYKGMLIILFSCLIVGGMMWISKPLWQGELLYYRLKVKIPEEYFEMMKYFKSQENNQRIAVMPIHTYNGWYIQDWEYTGSGFWFYGVDQPVLDRTFDVWGRENETYYQQMSRAVYSGDVDKFISILKQYRISFIVIDSSVEPADNNDKSLNLTGIKSLLSRVEAIQVFNKGSLSVWDVRQLLEMTNSNIWGIDKYVSVKSDSDYNRDNVIYRTQGDNITTDNSESELVYPFVNMTRELVEDVFYEENLVEVKRLISNGQLVIPKMDEGTELITTVKLTILKGLVVVNFEPAIQVISKDVNLPLFQLPEVFLPIPENMTRVEIVIGSDSKELNIGEEFVLPGIKFKVGEKLPIYLFDTNGISLDTNNFTSIQAKKCWEREGKTGILNVFTDGNEYMLEVTDMSACITMELDKFEQSGKLVVEQEYLTKDKGRPYFCIKKDLSDDICLNEEINLENQISKDWAIVEREVLIEPNESYWLDIIARSDDRPGVSNSITYRIPEVNFYPLLGKVGIDTSNMNIPMELEVSDELMVRMGSNFIRLNPINQEENLINNCSILNEGKVKKSIAEDGSALYQADNRAIACEGRDVMDLSTKNEYLVRLTGENISGYPLRIFLNNLANNHKDIDLILSTGVFDESIPLLNWTLLPERHYSFNVRTRSFGSETVVNRIDNIEAYQVPISWLSQLYIKNNKIVDFENIIKEENFDNNHQQGNVEIKNIKNIGTYYYKFAVQRDGLLILNQAYDDGWVAFFMDDIKPTFLDHVKVSGWANGWEVNSKLKVQSSKIEEVIYIIFWPQVLEYIGFLFLGALLLKVFWLRRRL